MLLLSVRSWNGYIYPSSMSGWS